MHEWKVPQELLLKIVRPTYMTLNTTQTKPNELHLMQSPQVNEFVTTTCIAGSNLVEKPTYKDGKVWINKEQYFGNVPESAWTFYIGGYQPAQKWLKDRKGRSLGSGGVVCWRRVVKVLVETAGVMQRIDKVAGF